jgi:hypothetical protein
MAEKNEAADVDREKATPVEPAEAVEAPAITGATFAERAAARQKADRKAVGSNDAENKAVGASESKSRRNRKG